MTLFRNKINILWIFCTNFIVIIQISRTLEALIFWLQYFLLIFMFEFLFCLKELTFFFMTVTKNLLFFKIESVLFSIN